jgi:hypothetical protein
LKKPPSATEVLSPVLQKTAGIEKKLDNIFYPCYTGAEIRGLRFRKSTMTKTINNLIRLIILLVVGILIGYGDGG